VPFGSSPGPREGVRVRATGGRRGTAGEQGAGRAARGGRRAHGGAQLDQCLEHQRVTPAALEPGGKRPGVPGERRAAERQGDRPDPGGDPRDVAVDRRLAAAEGERRDRRCRVGAHPGSRRSSSNPTASGRPPIAGGAWSCGKAYSSESRTPAGLVDRRGGERLDGEPGQEPCRRAPRLDLGLLRHHLGQQHAVGVAGQVAAPRQRTSRLSEPAEQPAGGSGGHRRSLAR
jgi:hypothetical protein